MNARTLSKSESAALTRRVTGLSVATADALDPTSQEDFVNGNCTLLLLNPSDVATVEADFFVGLPGP